MSKLREDLHAFLRATGESQRLRCLPRSLQLPRESPSSRVTKWRILRDDVIVHTDTSPKQMSQTPHNSDVTSDIRSCGADTGKYHLRSSRFRHAWYMYMPCPTHSLDLTVLILSGKDYRITKYLTT
jgi:hypothetical protein